jgi:hypothetical protein
VVSLSHCGSGVKRWNNKIVMYLIFSDLVMVLVFCADQRRAGADGILRAYQILSHKVIHSVCGQAAKA